MFMHPLLNRAQLLSVLGTVIQANVCFPVPKQKRALSPKVASADVGLLSALPSYCHLPQDLGVWLYIMNALRQFFDNCDSCNATSALAEMNKRSAHCLRVQQFYRAYNLQCEHWSAFR